MRTSRFFVASIALPTGLKPVLFSNLDFGDSSGDVSAAAGDLTLGVAAASKPSPVASTK